MVCHTVVMGRVYYMKGSIDGRFSKPKILSPNLILTLTIILNQALILPEANTKPYPKPYCVFNLKLNSHSK